MFNKAETTSNILGIFGVAIGIQDIQNVIGLLATIIGFMIAVINLFSLIARKIKEAKENDGKVSMDEITKIAEDVQKSDELKDVKTKIDEIKK
jgi:hypothetical protein